MTGFGKITGVMGWTHQVDCKAGVTVKKRGWPGFPASSGPVIGTVLCGWHGQEHQPGIGLGTSQLGLSGPQFPHL